MGGSRVVLRVSLHGGRVVGVNYQLPNGRYSQNINRCKERAKLERLGGNCAGRYFMSEILHALGIRMLESIGIFQRKEIFNRRP